MWDAAGVDPVGGSALPLGVWGCAAMCPAAHGSYTARVPPDDDAPFELGTDGPLSILVGVDGSTTSQRAGWYAAGLVRRQGARVTAVYVAPVSAGLAVAGAAAGLEAARREADEQITSDMRRRAAPLGAARSGFRPARAASLPPPRRWGWPRAACGPDGRARLRYRRRRGHWAVTACVLALGVACWARRAQAAQGGWRLPHRCPGRRDCRACRRRRGCLRGGQKSAVKSG